VPVRLVPVNGVAVGEFVSTLSSVVHGDTPRFRAILPGQCWWLYYGKRFGAPEHGENGTWRQPQLDDPLRFHGKVEVRIGAGGADRQAQSGGVRDARLPHSGLVITLPRFILDPPAGGRPGALRETTVDADRQSQVSS
jgi:hypothetical protein